VRGSPEILAHVGAVGAEGHVGEGLEEWRRLELELSARSTWTRQSSWHGRLGCGKAGGAGSTVRLMVNATLVLRRHIMAAQLDARMRPLSGNDGARGPQPVALATRQLAVGPRCTGK
jgi:hypothetical protein